MNYARGYMLLSERLFILYSCALSACQLSFQFVDLAREVAIVLDTTTYILNDVINVLVLFAVDCFVITSSRPKLLSLGRWWCLGCYDILQLVSLTIT